MNLQFDLQPSRWMTLLLVLGYLLAGLAICSLPLPEEVSFLAVALLAIHLTRMLWHRAWLRAPDAWAAIRVRGDEWTLRRRNGREVSTSLLEEGVATPWLTLVSLRDRGSGKVTRILLLKDSLDAEAFRRLRVLLRWGVAQRG